MATTEELARALLVLVRAVETSHGRCSYNRGPLGVGEEDECSIDAR